jgi:hypothetical protein
MGFRKGRIHVFFAACAGAAWGATEPDMDVASLRSNLRALRRRVYRRPYSGFGPMPHFAKLNALKRVFIPGAPVIETGTYQGDSARYFARQGFPVHTIEVSSELGAMAFPGLRALGVNCHQGDSATMLPEIMDKLTAQGVRGVNFWLDGHWSDGVTSTAPTHETPITQELDAVTERLSRFDRLCVAVDDLRCFGNDPEYPPKTYLVDWARERGLGIYFLADIFVASTEKYADL